MVMKFANQVKQLRTERGWSQDELAAKVFVSRQAVSKWENGDGNPDLETVVKLANLFGVSLDELVLATPVKTATPQIDERLYTYDPIKGEYVRRPQEWNFWRFASAYWWLVFPLGGFITWMVNKVW